MKTKITLQNNSRKLTRWGLIIMMLSTFGCIEDVSDVNLPIIEPKLVISSFISQNDTIRVKVSKSKPLNYNQVISSWYDNQFEPLPNAIVTITNTESGQSSTIPYYPEFGYYMLPPSGFMIEIGKEYELNASAQSFKPVTARTIVPSNLPSLISYKIDTLNTYNYEYGYSYYDIRFSGSIQDVAGEENFYTIGMSFWESYYNEWADTTYYYSNYYGGTSFTDSERDGEILTFKKDISISNWSAITLNILSTDAHYYRYHKSFYNWESENPFSEPSPIYSNIEGGLGIFASYTSVSIYLDENP